MDEIRPIQWDDGVLRLLDQTRLPLEEVTIEIRDYRAATDAICDMRVRGAPAIGVTAAYAVAMAASEFRTLCRPGTCRFTRPFRFPLRVREFSPFLNSGILQPPP
mgnify:CR=1 FL=1